MSARYLSLLLFLFPLLHKPDPTAPLRTGKDLAVFFAVEKYQNGSLTNLQNPVKNAREIAATLQSRFGFETEVLENPTQAQIIAKLNELTRLYANNADGRHPADGQLFLFFSGHGMSEDENGYFLPADADPAQPWAKGIAYEIWRPKIDRINCRHILVAIDACYSVRFDPDWKNRPDGQFKRPGELSDAQKALANYEQYTARVFFTSDNKEDKTPDRSNFARKLLEGLSAPPGPDGYLTSSQLFANHVQGATPTPRAGNFGSDDPRATFLFFGQTETPDDPDEATWRSAQRQNTPEAYAYYLAAYPQGRYRAQALDERAWLLAVQQNTPAAYQIYLDTNPNGRHRSEAAAKVISPAPVEQRPGADALIPGGAFQMGSNNGEADEKPVHTVTLGSFYLAKYEVTVAEFKAFTDATGYKTDAEKEGWSYRWNGKEWEKMNGVNWRHDAQGNLRPQSEYDHPVIHVSWNDATAYCQWMAKKTSLPYRLPTEAEWEYAAGNGAKHTRYSWGDNAPAGKQGGNVADETGAAAFNWTRSNDNIFMDYRDGFATTAPVGAFNPNESGLYDMTGNVWEWCNDWKGPYPSEPQTNPTGPTTGSDRVVRGGSWFYYPQYCRVANRNGGTPGARNDSIGFRLARTL
ncbi:MAG: SUMF1/EgtB/PvdO family nonheme iron enzyme [Saprospiraceae bacterium]|nr:SUMF1/EgtB/PvdO family nonheme iron enzyme [Saprospiraceae bacterium]